MQLNLLPLKKAIARLVIGIALTATLVILPQVIVTAEDDAQTIDMSQLTCAKFDDLGNMEQMMSMIWFSGWTAQKQGDLTFTPNRGAMSARKDALETACENNQQDLVMNQL
jgi:HdeA/HdeB family